VLDGFDPLGYDSQWVAKVERPISDHMQSWREGNTLVNVQYHYRYSTQSSDHG
jgi:hypothetical protein